MSDDMARVTKVRPAGGRVLRVRFAGDRREREIDLTGLIARSAHFKPLLEDAETFGKVAIVEDGLGIGWAVQTKWGPLDLSASTLRQHSSEVSCARALPVLQTPHFYGAARRNAPCPLP